MEFTVRRYPSSDGWVGRVFGLLAIAVAASGTFAAPAGVLFPEPLHIVREVEDSISGRTSTIHEYCAGNRIITVNGARTAIADYGRGQLTEIDKSNATFSIASFEDIARISAPLSSKPTTRSFGDGRSLGTKRTTDGRNVESYEFADDDQNERLRVTVGVDRATTLSTAALEALIGAAFPNRRSVTHDAILRAAAPASPGRRVQTTALPDTFALPWEHVVTYDIGPERITHRSTIVLIDRELVPDELISIPPGSRRVEPRTIALPREIESLDRLPQTSRP